MPQLLSFPAWLVTSPPAWFAALGRTRLDLARTDITSPGRFAAAAAARASVATGIEALDAGTLNVLLTAARAARVRPEVDAEVFAGRTEALATLLVFGLVWPAHTSGAAEPLSAGSFRVQPECLTLLPTAAAQLADPPAWVGLPEPTIHRELDIPASLLDNAQAAAAAALLSDLAAVLGAFADSPADQLTSGGVGKRDMTQLARATGLPFAHAVFLTELAGAAGLLGIGGTSEGPVWLPTAAYDELLAADRAETYTELVRIWLGMHVDVSHVLAGATATGERVHSLSQVLRPTRHHPYGGFPFSRPQMPVLKAEVLARLLAVGRGRAIEAEDLFAELHHARPMLAALTRAGFDELVTEAETFGLVCTPLKSPHAYGLTEAGRLVAAGLRSAWSPEATPTPSIPSPAEASPGSTSIVTGAAAGRPRPGRLVSFDETRIVVDPALTDLLRGILPELQTTVLVQSDLTAVATGPVDPRIHARLDHLARTENRGQGTVYRFTEESIGAALQAGETAEGIREFLDSVATAALPQPLAFLIDEAASKLHRVRVTGAHSVLVTDTEEDLDALFDHPLLVPAGLRRLDARVASASVSQDRLAALLEAAEQPVAGFGTQVSGPTRAQTPTPARPVTRRSTRIPAGQVDEFLARLRSTPERPAAEGSTGALSVLGEAIATKSAVVLTYAAADGASHKIEFLPRSVGAGWVRGLRGSGGNEISIAVPRIQDVRPVDERRT